MTEYSQFFKRTNIRLFFIINRRPATITDQQVANKQRQTKSEMLLTASCH
ncbi:hypothetical protein ACTHHL_14415 [Aeribacillus composti]